MEWNDHSFWNDLKCVWLVIWNDHSIPLIIPFPFIMLFFIPILIGRFNFIPSQLASRHRSIYRSPLSIHTSQHPRSSLSIHHLLTSITVMEPSTHDSERGAGKNKRKWSKIEDEKLIEALLELVNAGTHKADNGFRPGYLAILEDALLTKLPGSDLKARPHIESRIKTLKKDFTTVYDMRFGPTSGFGWDDKNHLVTAPSHVWDAYLKIGQLVMMQRYQAAKKMADNENLMILFFAAPNDEKEDFVQALLRGDI